MRILFLGDVVGFSGCTKITNNLSDEIKILDNISKINNKNDQLLLIQSGKTTREDIENFKRRINYGGFSIVGWILFEETISYDLINLKN